MITNMTIEDTIAAMLDAANVPRKIAALEGGEGAERELLIGERVAQLISQRDWLSKSRDADHVEIKAQLVEVAKEVSETETLFAEANRKLNEAEANLSEMCISLRQALEAESVAEALEEAKRLRKDNADQREAVRYLCEKFEADALEFKQNAEGLQAQLHATADERDQANARARAANARADEADAKLAECGRQRDDALRDLAFFRDQADKASAEALAQRDRARNVEADRDLVADALTKRERELEEQVAIADALEAEVATLEARLDRVDGWGDGERAEADAIVRRIARAPNRRPRVAS